MKKHEIISKVKSLKLSDKSYVVFGSCPLAAFDLREANDIDMLVSEEVFELLKSKGWKQIDKGPKDKPITLDTFEAHKSWDFSPYSPSLNHLLSTALIIDGVPFAALEEVKKWKQGRMSNKDRLDIKLIDNFLTSR